MIYGVFYNIPRILSTADRKGLFISFFPVIKMWKFMTGYGKGFSQEQAGGERLFGFMILSIDIVCFVLRNFIKTGRFYF